jgi:hypothetical protein
VITVECTRGLQEIINGEQNEIGRGRDWERREKKNENIWKKSRLERGKKEKLE